MTVRCLVRLFALASLLVSSAQAVTLNIPATHPRLWLGNQARLQQARGYFLLNPISASANDFYTRALNGVINGNAADCTAAAHYFRDYIVGANESFRDDIRQNGEDLLLMFDWCHDKLTPDEIHTVVDRWNGYLDQEFNDQSLGNDGKEANNYWAGRVMNFLLWGIASFHDTGTNGQSTAQKYIDYALVDRMGTGFTRWYGDFGTGGVFPEGDEYGVVSLAYPLIAFTSAADFGYDEYLHTNYYREAIYALIYGTTPGPTTSLHGPSNQYSMIPFNDDELFVDGAPIIGRDYLGDFATLFGTRLPGSGNSKHILAWQAASHAGRRSLFDALGTTGNPSDLAGLPLDYFAPGAAVFDMRTSHDPTSAMQVHLQLGTPGGTEHRHLDGGSFQVWRKGRWMTRESVGYSNNLVGYNGATDTIDVSDAPAHNALLFEGRSTGEWIGDDGPQVVSPGGDQPRGIPQVIRLQHENEFGFVAADYSLAYRNGRDTRVDWPYADKALREFLFIRPLQALIILDRMQGSSDSQDSYYSTSNWLETGPHEAGANVRRGFIMHFESQPTANAVGDRMDAPAGTQTSELITLVPATPYKSGNVNARVVNERVASPSQGDIDAAQYRLELDSVGTAQSYFLNIVTGYDGGDAPITATMVESATQWTITLTHPTRGTAAIILLKGMTSTGGSVQIGNEAAIPLRQDVQGISVTDAGPIWQTDLIFADDFEVH